MVFCPKYLNLFNLEAVTDVASEIVNLLPNTMDNHRLCVELFALLV